MKLDPRISDIKNIGNPFNAEDFKPYIGKKCYVAPSMGAFWNLDKCVVETLSCIEPDFNYPYETETDTWMFCLPVEFVTPNGGSRPFTLEEFMDRFALLSSVMFRKKNDKECEIYTIFSGYGKRGPKACVYLGTRAWFLEELFDEYEWQDPASGKWKPFGVGS